MNIIHISTTDILGGASQAAYRLHKGLLALGHNSRMLVGYKYSNDSEVEGIWFNKKALFKKFQSLIGRIETRTGLQYLIQPFRNSFLRHPWARDADVINLHNIHGNFFSHLILPRLTVLKPTVWTLHDMWPMTEHCGYPEMYGCTVWQTGQGKCAAPESYPPVKRNLGAYLWRRKKIAYEQSTFTLVGPSQWICNMAGKSPLLQRFPVHYIPYGLDTELFRPIDHREARHKLGIPEDASVIMTYALPNDERKGLSYFIKAVPCLACTPRPWILVLGSQGILSAQVHGFPIREQGFINDPQLLNVCLNAADVFVLPTLADNLPLSIQEALATGTPVVAFDVGGVPDLVRQGKTGYLARYKDAQDLARGIDVLLRDKNLRDTMSIQAREIALAEYCLKGRAEDYLQLYSQIFKQEPTQGLKGLVS